MNKPQKPTMDPIALLAGGHLQTLGPTASLTLAAYLLEALATLKETGTTDDMKDIGTRADRGLNAMASAPLIQVVPAPVINLRK